MWAIKARKFIRFATGVLLVMCGLGSCKKSAVTTERIKPPIRSYVVTARIDKKGTNTNSEGTAVLKGSYDEGTKILSYRLEYEDIVPQLITLRNGPKGSKGVLVKELYSNTGATVPLPLSGEFRLTSLEERNLLRGLWFVAINTLTLSPEISGVVTLKQK